MNTTEWIGNAFRGDLVKQSTLKAIKNVIGNDAFEKLVGHILPRLIELGCRKALLALLNLQEFKDGNPSLTFFNPVFHLLLSTEVPPAELTVEDYRKAVGNPIVHPVHLAALNPSGEPLKWINANIGAEELKVKSGTGETVAHFAAVCDSDVNLKFAEEQGVDLGVKETEQLQTPLMWCLRANKSLDIAKHIVSTKGRGALNDKDKEKFTPVQYLGRYGVQGDASEWVNYF